MSDTIYRQEAIDAIYEHEFSNWCDKDEVSTILYDLPSADRPQGEWIRDDIGTLICSECKRPRRDNRIGHTNFCNSCGAQMKGAGND